MGDVIVLDNEFRESIRELIADLRADAIAADEEAELHRSASARDAVVGTATYKQHAGEIIHTCEARAAALRWVADHAARALGEADV